MQLFAYNWKLPAYSGAFLLTVDNFSFFTYSWSFFTYSFSFFNCNWSFFAYNGKVRLISALRDCKQRSLTESKKGPTGSKLSGPVRDTPPYRAIPCRDSIAEGDIAPICLVFIGYRASIAEIPLFGGGGYRTSTSHAFQGGNAQKRGRGYRTQLAMLRHQKPHSAQKGGIAEIGVSETGSAKTGVRNRYVCIDDAGSILKFRIGFSL